MGMEAEFFHALIALLCTILIAIGTQQKKVMWRLNKRQKIMTFILLEMARPNIELREKLAPEFSKLIEMNGD